MIPDGAREGWLVAVLHNGAHNAAARRLASERREREAQHALELEAIGEVIERLASGCGGPFTIPALVDRVSFYLAHALA